MLSITQPQLLNMQDIGLKYIRLMVLIDGIVLFSLQNQCLQNLLLVSGLEQERKDGSLKHQWVKTYQANEALDTLNNNLGLHTILFLNYSEDRWKGLEIS